MLLALISSATAVAQTQNQTQIQSASSRERSLALAAEQAFASLDYTSAYRAGVQVLGLNPRNLTIRRLAAASALQLKRFNDCIRLMAAVPPAETSSDDVHTLGECSQGLGTFAPSLLRNFEALKTDPNRSDAAHYWLGVAAYRASNFKLAKGLLDSVVVLPTRLEGPKRFMLERIADVESADQGSQTNRASDQPAKPSKPPPDGQQPPPAQLQGDRTKPGRSNSRIDLIPRRSAQNGWFSGFGGGAQVGAFGGVIDRVSVLPDAQKDYDRDVEAARAANRNPNPETIETKTGSIVSPLIALNAKVSTGYRTADFVSDRGTQYGLDLMFSGAYSSIESSFYAVHGTKMHPAASAAIHAPGAGLRLSNHIEIRPNPAIGFLVETYIDRLANGLDKQFGQAGGRGKVWLEGEHMVLGATAFWNLLMGPDLVIGSHWNGVELDLSIKEVGMFSLRAPPGHSLASFQVSTSIPKSQTTGVFQLMSLDGRFWEFNVAPTLSFAPWFKTFVWYRLVSGTARAYRSSVSKEIQIRQDDYEAKNPDSQFESTLHDLSVALEYTPWSWGGVVAGISASYFGTRYALDEVPADPTAPDAKPFDYQPLLDRGRQNVTVGFLSLYSRF
jgi:hypothetical protein